jgi:hypothetical protein
MPVVARGDVDNQAGCHIVLQNHHSQSERPDPTANSSRGYLRPLSMHILHEVKPNS